MFIQRIQKAQLGFVVCLMAVMFYETSFAGQSDDFTLTVAAGKPPVKPDMASINEDVEFNFVPKFTDKNGKHIEETPSDVKSVSYTLTSDAEKITSCTPNMTISADKKSASETTTTLQNVSAVLRYAAESEHTLTLVVTVTFKDDSTLSGSYTITVKVCKATITVYAKKTEVVVKQQKNGKDALFWEYGDVGHSFWKISVSNPQEFLTAAERVENGGKWGHYPKNGLSPDKSALNETDGKICDDTNHLFDASHSFTIKLNDAKSALAETKQLLADNNLKYQLTNLVARNCTGQCVRVANDFAKSGSPDGKGWIWMTVDMFGTSVAVPCSLQNPYHHGLALENLPNQP